MEEIQFSLTLFTPGFRLSQQFSSARCQRNEQSERKDVDLGHSSLQSMILDKAVGTWIDALFMRKNILASTLIVLIQGDPDIVGTGRESINAFYPVFYNNYICQYWKAIFCRATDWFKKPSYEASRNLDIFYQI